MKAEAVVRTPGRSFGVGEADTGCHDQPDFHDSGHFVHSTVRHLEAGLLRPAVVVGGGSPSLCHRLLSHDHCSAYSRLVVIYVGVRGDECEIGSGRRSCRRTIWNRGCYCGRACFCRVHVASVTMTVGDVVVMMSSFVRRAASQPCSRSS